MRPDCALHMALDLLRTPTMSAAMRAHGLPRDVLTVIQIAAASDVALAAGVDKTRRSRAHLRHAAEFYLQQMLFFKGADEYRTLGVQPGCSREQMRQHMRWLLMWLHPDHNRNEWQAVYAERVIAAWRIVGRAAQVGAGAPQPLVATHLGRTSRRPVRATLSRPSWVRVPLDKPVRRSGLRARYLVAMIVVCAILAVPNFHSADTGAKTREPRLPLGAALPRPSPWKIAR